MNTINEQVTRYSDADLSEFKALITRKLEKSLSEVTLYKQQLSAMADTDSKLKSLEDGTSTVEMERISNLLNRQEKFTTHLKNALIRIDNKVYGICRKTGKLISKDRLRAVPHATLSIEAKMMQK